MNKLELIKYKIELIKTKAELKKLAQEYEPYMSLEERKEIDNSIKEIDEIMNSLEETKVMYDISAFVDIYEAQDYISDCAHKGYTIQQISTSGTGIVTILAKKIITK